MARRRNPFNATKPAEWETMSKKARKRWNRTHWRPDQWKCDLALKKEATRLKHRSERAGRGLMTLAERLVERSNPRTLIEQADEEERIHREHEKERAALAADVRSHVVTGRDAGYDDDTIWVNLQDTYEENGLLELWRRHHAFIEHVFDKACRGSRSNPLVRIPLPKGVSLGDHKRLRSWASWYKEHGRPKKRANPFVTGLAKRLQAEAAEERDDYWNWYNIAREYEKATKDGKDDLRNRLRIAYSKLDSPKKRANPYPHEHAARLIDPARMRKSTFRRKNVKGGTIGLIMAKPLFGKQVMTLQAVRFRAAHFSPSEAKRWLKRHNLRPVMFEPATKSRKASWAAESVRKKRSRARRTLRRKQA